MKGSHYNLAWLVHNTVAEAMEYLLMHRYFGELNLQLPTELAELAEHNLFNEKIINSNESFIQKYENFKDQVRCGAYGKTPQY